MEIKIDARRLAMRAILGLLRKSKNGSFYIERTSNALVEAVSTVKSITPFDDEDETLFEVYLFPSGVMVSAKGTIVGNQIHATVSVNDFDNECDLGSEPLDIDIERAFDNNEFGDVICNIHI